MTSSIEVLSEDLPLLGEEGKDPLEAVARQLLVEIGEDPEREGLRDTPARYARWWREFTQYDPGSVDTLFETTASGNLVGVSGISVWSLCEHHLLPFSCRFTIGYLPQEKMLGLSKFARIAHQHAHKLQSQEQLSQQIADEVERLTGSPDVAVIGRGEHLCMAMRGIRTPATMTTAVWRGALKDSALRSELIALTSDSNR
ncbi:GTP cyclohydrolase I [Streptomyces tubercidicus]|uniref:GTP cyclohydrolase 1 n=1 Tax=Streptomyces tubercidicus TaxID=47759 RepID=A0A384YVR0_9ACTN|nr:GTP cyclohydrolase I FolE [Streptomyces tubercidicus]AVW83011.1 GTP cyclohydrolase I [Streptomyces tubercidicus]WAU11134.1 GTP cyclohydrolase I [Streptomyces tubercidicus]GFE36354.1 GTP cyclohydrolase 1 [Streptomyces tubercidicus]